MRKLTLVLFISAALLRGSCQCQQPTTENVDSAKRVWESVIAAKGGRERLQRVRTFGLRLDGGRSWYQMFAFDFPSRLWKRTGPIETHVLAIDAERGTESSASRYYPDPHRSRKQIENSTSSTNATSAKLAVDNEACNALATFLLESSWYQPEITGLEEITRGGRRALVVYVNSCKGAAAYVVDAETRLPTEYVAFVNAISRKGPPRINDGFPQASFPLSDYAPTDGIMLPRLFRGAKMTYEVNRDYPKSLFTTAPKLSDWGPWERR